MIRLLCLLLFFFFFSIFSFRDDLYTHFNSVFFIFCVCLFWPNIIKTKHNKNIQTVYNSWSTTMSLTLLYNFMKLWCVFSIFFLLFMNKGNMQYMLYIVHDEPRAVLCFVVVSYFVFQ